MNVFFRCDASIQIGTGHVMRCLTLADEFSKSGAKCYFICRDHEGHLIEFIRQKNYQTFVLPLDDNETTGDLTHSYLFHSQWLGGSQENDALLTKVIIESFIPEWLIVDHYALDKTWETNLRPYCDNILVIDDLADRSHDCDILLDQTYGRHRGDYENLTPKNCHILTGTEYALLRPEFKKWRKYSLEHKHKGLLNHILVNLGGVDKDNITSKVLEAIEQTSLPNSCKITVVMGATSPWIELVVNKASALSLDTEVKTGVSNMAEIMANSDLAFGAAGSTSWERCCLGLPTLMLVLADNQKDIANNLQRIKAVRTIQINHLKNDIKLHLEDLLHNPSNLIAMSTASANVLNGNGATLVAEYMKKPIYE